MERGVIRTDIEITKNWARETNLPRLREQWHPKQHFITVEITQNIPFYKFIKCSKIIINIFIAWDQKIVKMISRTVFHWFWVEKKIFSQKAIPIIAVPFKNTPGNIKCFYFMKGVVFLSNKSPSFFLAIRYIWPFFDCEILTK